MHNRFIYYFQLFFSVFLLTACVGTLNVQMEPPKNNPPAQKTLPVSGTDPEKAPVSTITSTRPVVAGTLDEVKSGQSHQPTATDNSATADFSGYKNPIFIYDPSLATSTVIESRPAVPVTSDSPYWQVLPDRTQITLSDYPISDSLFKPQIFIYPVDQYKQKSETAGKVIDALKELIKSKPTGQAPIPDFNPEEQFPFLPLVDAQQIIHAQVSYFAFKNGQGVRYLTQFSQGMNPIINRDLIYTYQGLTDDGKYYISAILPVNLPSLPSGYSMAQGNDYGAYVKGMVQQLDSQETTDFNPVLVYLDDLMASFDIK